MKRFSTSSLPRRYTICGFAFVVNSLPMNLILIANAPIASAVSAPHGAQNPAPNARDFYLRAGKAIRYSKDTYGDYPLFNDAKKNAKTPANVRRAFFLRRNQNALALLHQDFRYTYGPPIQIHYDPWQQMDVFSQFAKMRELARLLSIEGDFRAARGEDIKALNCGADAMRLGIDMQKGSDLTASLVGDAIESIGFGQLKKTYIDKIDARSARILAQRILRLDTRRVPYAQTLRGEKTHGLGLLQWTFSQPDPQKQLPQDQTPAQIKATYARRMDELAINAALPYQQRRPFVLGKVDLLNQTMLSNY